MLLKSLYKFFAVLISVSICVSVCAFPAFAATGGGAGGNRDDNFVKYSVDYLKTVYQYCKDVISSGEVDVSTFPSATSDYISKTSSLALDTATQSIKDNLTTAVDALSMAPSRETVNAVVERGRDLLDYCGIDYGKTETTQQTTDMRGCGARLDVFGGSDYVITWCEYITVKGSRYYPYGKGYFLWKDGYSGNSNMSGSTYAEIGNKSGTIGFINTTDIVVYGDVRYSDGTPATDITQPTTETIYTNDPSSLTDTQLIDLLEDLLLNLKLDYPDLSSVEGLLSAILTKLGTLDSDNDNGLLSDIYIAIESLKNDNHAESQQIISILEEIRDNITGSSGSGESSDTSELMEELKEISKNLKYLVGLETIDVVTDVIDFDNIEFTDFDNSFFDKYGQLINTVINKFGYGPVNEMLKTCHSIVFNTSAPADLTFNYGGYDFTLLSTEMFEDDDVKQSLTLVKSFLSIFILIGFLSVMRKRIVSS